MKSLKCKTLAAILGTVWLGGSLAAILGTVWLGWLVGCDLEQDMEEREKRLDREATREMHYLNFDGHEYVKFSRFRQAGIAHSPKCECRKFSD